VCSTTVSQYLSQGFPVGHVARSHRRRRAELRQLGHQLGRTGCLGTSAAGEQQVPHPVLSDQVLGEQAAEGASAAGDEHGILGLDSERSLRRRRRQSGQPPGTDHACPDRDFRLV
jgi:hypothetical protein